MMTGRSNYVKWCASVRVYDRSVRGCGGWVK